MMLKGGEVILREEWKQERGWKALADEAWLRSSVGQRWGGKYTKEGGFSP